MARLADLLGDRLTDPHRDLLVVVGALLAGDVLAHLVRHVPTHGVRHLLLLGLAHVLARVVGVLFAGAGDGSPDLVVAVAFPLVLTVLLVLSADSVSVYGSYS